MSLPWMLYSSPKRFTKKLKKKQIINNRFIRNLYCITDDKILSINYFDPAKAVKITISRLIPSGSIGDTDIYGAQQHIPLANSIVNLVVPCKN